MTNGDITKSDDPAKWSHLNKINYWYSLESRFHSHRKVFQQQISHFILPDNVVKTAVDLYRQIWLAGLFRNHDTGAIALACIYYAAEICKYALTITEIILATSEDSEVKDERDARTSPKQKKLSASISIVKSFISNSKKIPLHKGRVSDLIPKVANKLGIPFGSAKEAIELYNDAREHGFDPSGKNRLAIAGAALYIVATYNKQRILQAEICQRIRTTEITLRSRIREILDTSLKVYATDYKHATKARKAIVTEPQEIASTASFEILSE